MAIYQTLRRKRPSIQMSLFVALLIAIPIFAYICVSAFLILKKDNIIENMRRNELSLQLQLEQKEFEYNAQIKDLNDRIKELEERVKILDIIEEFKPADETSALTPEDSKKLALVIQTESHRYGYDPLLILALIAAESTFRADARSIKGATGLMQVMPNTAHEIANNLVNNSLTEEEPFQFRGHESLKDPFQNVQIGMFHLARLILQFGDVKNGIRAYNHGEYNIKSRIRNGGGLPRAYLKKVLTFYNQFRASPSNFDAEKLSIKVQTGASLVSAEAMPIVDATTPLSGADMEPEESGVKGTEAAVPTPAFLALPGGSDSEPSRAVAVQSATGTVRHVTE